MYTRDNVERCYCCNVVIRNHVWVLGTHIRCSIKCEREHAENWCLNHGDSAKRVKRLSGKGSGRRKNNAGS